MSRIGGLELLWDICHAPEDGDHVLSESAALRHAHALPGETHRHPSGLGRDDGDVQVGPIVEMRDRIAQRDVARDVRLVEHAQIAQGNRGEGGLVVLVFLRHLLGSAGGHRVDRPRHGPEDALCVMGE